MRIFLLLLLLCIATCVTIVAQPDSTLINKAVELYDKGEYEKALPDFEKCLAAAKLTTDKRSQADIYNYIGHIYSQTGKVTNAFQAYHQAASISDDIGNKNASARAMINIGALYEEQKDYKKALDNYSKAEAIGLLIRDSSVIADCANNKGVVYEQYLKKYPEALREYNKALLIYAKLNDRRHLAITYNNLGIVYKYQGNYVKAIDQYKRSLRIGEAIGNQFLIAANMTNIGNVYAMQKDYINAIAYNTDGLNIALKIKAMNVVVEAAGSIAEDYAGMKDYKRAFEWQQKFSQYSDSLFNAERSKQIAELEGKYQTAKKEKEITLLKDEQLINQLNISSQKILLQKRNYQFAGIGGLVLLMGIVAFLLYNRQQLKQKQQKEKAILEAEYKERKRISREMHDDIGAGLTQITLMSEHAKIHQQPTYINDLSAIASTSRKLISNMSEIVWSLNPENKTPDQLFSYLREQLNNLLEYSAIDYKINFAATDCSHVLSNEQKRNIILATKEIVHNAVKYSKAKNIYVNALVRNGLIQFNITDDGCGFDTGANFTGNGLKNIKQRIKEIGGTLVIESVHLKNTSFSYSLPLKAQP
ncbi:MAG: tetratricopeptide repeat protein [Chitinophagaceae bacterium]|nr:tetratricopeptide repeat protein [Chitinophagaceae bacterium]